MYVDVGGCQDCNAPSAYILCDCNVCGSFGTQGTMLSTIHLCVQRFVCATIPVHRSPQGPHAFPPAPCGYFRKGRWGRYVISCEGHICNILATWVASLPLTYNVVSLCFVGCVCTLRGANLLFNVDVVDIGSPSPQNYMFVFLLPSMCQTQNIMHFQPEQIKHNNLQ